MGKRMATAKQIAEVWEMIEVHVKDSTVLSIRPDYQDVFESVKKEIHEIVEAKRVAAQLPVSGKIRGRR